MAFKYKSIEKDLSQIITCTICCDTYKEPKSLPCAHSFCLNCLKGYSEAMLVGDDVPCPVCRQKIRIPDGNYEALPNAFIIEQLLEMCKKPEKVDSDNDGKLECDVCSTTAAGYCIQCEQNLCYSCSSIHPKVRATQSHTVLTLEEKRGVTAIRKKRLLCYSQGGRTQAVLL